MRRMARNSVNSLEGGYCGNFGMYGVKINCQSFKYLFFRLFFREILESCQHTVAHASATGHLFDDRHHFFHCITFKVSIRNLVPTGSGTLVRSVFLMYTCKCILFTTKPYIKVIVQLLLGF